MGNEYVMMNVKLPAGTSYVRTDVTEEGLKIFCVDTAESIVNNNDLTCKTTENGKEHHSTNKVSLAELIDCIESRNDET